MPETASDQVVLPNTVFKPIADAVEEVCERIAPTFKDVSFIGDVASTVKSLLKEWSLLATSKPGMLRIGALVVALKAVILKCPVFLRINRQEIVKLLDHFLGQKVDSNIKDITPLSLTRDERVGLARASVPISGLEDAVVRILWLNVAKVLSIETLRDWGQGDKLFASLDAKRHKYIITFRLPNLFSRGDLEELVVEVGTATVNAVLRLRDKFDERQGKGKSKRKEDEDEEGGLSTHGVPKVLENYLAEFIQRGWLPQFSSFEFVSLILQLVNERRTVFNTPIDDIRAALVSAFSRFNYVEVRKEGEKKVMETRILPDVNDVVYVERLEKPEDKKAEQKSEEEVPEGEILVPMGLYRSIEVRTTSKTALTRRLETLGVLKSVDSTYSIWFRDAPKPFRIRGMLFDRAKLTKFLGVDPVALMHSFMPRLDLNSILEEEEQQQQQEEQEQDVTMGGSDVTN
jgi:hypothetical protein